MHISGVKLYIYIYICRYTGMECNFEDSQDWCHSTRKASYLNLLSVVSGDGQSTGSNCWLHTASTNRNNPVGGFLVRKCRALICAPTSDIKWVRERERETFLLQLLCLTEPLAASEVLSTNNTTRFWSEVNYHNLYKWQVCQEMLRMVQSYRNSKLFLSSCWISGPDIIFFQLYFL